MSATDGKTGESGRLFLEDRRRSARVLLLSLLAAVLAATAGCASAPPYRTHPELPRRKSGIAAVGVLPPSITMFEEQARFGLNEAIPHDEWSSAAVDAVARAFAEEMAADHVPLVPIPAEDPEAKEFVAIYSAVEFSILRHAFEKNTGEILPREPFPEQIRTLDYSLGPVAELMDRHHVDAVWIVRGFNLLPTTGATVKHGVDITLSILSALGGIVVPVIDLQKIQLRVALVDRTGSILYYGVADDRTASPDAEPPIQASPADGGPVPVSPEEPTYPPVDLRDPRAARHYLQAALSAYRGAAAP
jgi:hypothetical protein